MNKDGKPIKIISFLHQIINTLVKVVEGLGTIYVIACFWLL